ncbi:TrmB family transcriptional regulator [Candidatus Woesearchaeota archaeon]|nr:TrmB family transcriptional regulator [Candidatus Woesearchaeota archaeon]
MPQPFEDTKLLEDFKTIGLSEYESKVYLALLINGPMSGNETHRASGVPHGKTYNTLEKLQERGLVNILTERPKVFKAVDPSIVIEDMLEKKLHKFQELHKNLPSKLESMKRTKLKEEPISEKIQFVCEESHAMFNRLYRTAKKSLRRIYTCEEQHYERVRIIDELIKKGVKVQFLVTKLTERGLEWSRDDVKRGVEVRYYPVENIRLNIKDDSEVIITILNPKNPVDRIFLYAQSEGLTKAMNFYFDYLWKQAKPLPMK